MPPPPMALPGTYDFARDAWFKGLGAVGKAIGPVTVLKPNVPRGLDRARTGLRQHITQQLPSSSAGIAIALATGDQNAVGADDADAMRRSGLTHLLSVSGLHIAAVVAFAMILTLKVFSIVLSRLALEQAGIRFQLGTPEILWLIAAMGPLALIAPAAQAYLSCFARSFKEAQSYTVVLVLPVVFLGVISTFYPLTNRPWILAIPFLGQYSLAAEVLAGRTPPSPLLIAVGLEALALTGVLLGLVRPRAKLAPLKRVAARRRDWRTMASAAPKNQPTCSTSRSRTPNSSASCLASRSRAPSTPRSTAARTPCAEPRCD